MYETGLEYRTREEVNEWLARDPIQQLERKLTSEKLATLEEVEAIRSKVKSNIREAVKFAQQRPYPPDDLLAKFVWA
jgi:pyruvate dehydrogenase E1 component alpha subunit